MIRRIACGDDSSNRLYGHCRFSLWEYDAEPGLPRASASLFMQLFTRIYRVGEITRHLREVIEDDSLLGDVWVQGEVSDCRQYASGHLYFSLKDESASIRCVMWRAQAARLERLVRDGEAVRVRGGFSGT